MFNKKISKKLIKFNMVLSRNFLVIPLIISSIFVQARLHLSSDHSVNKIS